MLKCCRCRMTGAIPRSSWRPAAPTKNTGSAHCASGGVGSPSPVLMIFEDAHWTDPTSLEALGRMVDRITNASRAADRDLPAGIRAALGRQPHVTALTLNRLAEREVLP